MALQLCRECGNHVSTKAKTCPLCGAPVKQRSSPVAVGCVTVIVFVTFIFICILFCSGVFNYDLSSVNFRSSKVSSTTEPSPKTKEHSSSPTAKGLSSEELLEQQQKFLDKYMKSLATLGIDSSIIKSVSGKGNTITITVTNAWHYQPYQVRLQAAQNLWKLWASICSPSDPDQARLSVVDFNDNEVGGSRWLAGSLIWVKE